MNDFILGFVLGVATLAASTMTGLAILVVVR